MRRPIVSSSRFGWLPAAAGGLLLLLLTAACGDSPTSPTPPPPATGPTVTSVSPTAGSTAGGTEISITGTSFYAGATVAVGGVAATNVRVLGTTGIVAVTGAHAAGLVDLTLSVAGQSASLAGAFTYTVPPAPTVTGIVPPSGPTAGGTSVTMTGTNFAAGATVTIGGVAATGIDVVSATTIRAVTSPRGAGAGDVVVTVGAQIATLPAGFTFTLPPVNPLPVIAGISVQGTRSNQPANFADLGEEIAVTATVQDAETPVSQLLMEWTADGGTFSGTGPAVRWRAPAAGQTPAIYQLTLRVTEILGVLGDMPGVAAQSVTASVTVRVHDSTKEVGNLSVGFLLDFSNSSLAPEYVVRNFWDGCSGKAAELTDVTNNRKDFLITGYKIGNPTSVTISFSGTCALNEKGDACAVVPCEWNDVYKPLNEAGSSTGTCYLSTVYRDSKWWLCGSRFQGTSTHPPRFGVTFMR